VRDELEHPPGKLRYHVLGGPTGCGKTRLLGALAEVGAQVLDLEDLARHRGSLIGDIPGVAQPSQKWFDSLLVDKLRRFDPSQPVWVEAESKKIGRIEIPTALLESMRASPLFSVKAPMSERVSLWREDYSHFGHDPNAMVERLHTCVHWSEARVCAMGTASRRTACRRIVPEAHGGALRSRLFALASQELSASRDRCPSSSIA
jgi:tRNA 2-selenouridine synthase